MKQKSSSELTVDFLHAISDHLSGRKSCRGIEYVVCIGMDDDGIERQISLADVNDITDKIFFYPERSVFPDTFHRQKSDLIDIVSHVLCEHFKDTVYSHHDFTKPCFKKGTLVPGIYKYILSFDKRRRQWIRVK